MMKYLKFLSSVLVCTAVMFAAVGCTKVPVSNRPEVQVSPSPNAGAAQQASGLLQKPSPTPEAAKPATAPSEEPLGFELPAADANGCRSYQWHDQIVVDWLGDFAQADALRNMLLTRLDGKQKEDYYILFLGRPLAVEGGWLLPAGKRTDGEWLPSLYHIAMDSTGLHILGKAENYVWTLNRTYTYLPNGGCTSYFGHAKILGADSSIGSVRAEATFADETKARSDIPQGYPYLLLVHTGDSQITDLAYFEAQTGTPLKMLDIMDGYNWSKYKGAQRTAILQKNITMAPMFDIASNLPWEERPELCRVGASEPYEACGYIYAADLHNSAHLLRAIASAPLEQIAMEQPIPMHLKPAHRVRLSIRSKAWGNPTKVKTMLTMPDGTIRELAFKDGEIDTGKLESGGRYLIYIRVEYDEKGWIEWVIHLDE